MDFDLIDGIELKEEGFPKYKQLAESIKHNVIRGTLAPGVKLPSLNSFAEGLAINRLTVLRALDELEIEGWLVKREKSGVFVAEKLPDYEPSALIGGQECIAHLPDLHLPTVILTEKIFSPLNFDEGYPDHRLFPVDDLARAYSTVLKDLKVEQSHYGDGRQALLYNHPHGHEKLRQALSTFNHRTRGIPSAPENVMITRGSTMGIYLAALTVCHPGDTVAMTDPGYYFARQTFLNLGLKVVSVTVDREGLDINHLEDVLKDHQIRMLYITPHHDYPTTVSLPAERRLDLLRLAREKGFYLLEDDYDFDFQYDRSPILPIASIDKLQSVIYIGGFSKSLSPALRIGFMLANPQVIDGAARWRKLIDLQGDTIMELAFLRLLSQGTVESSIRKSRKIYAGRRDNTYTLFKERLGHLFEPDFPGGGLAMWTKCLMSYDKYEEFRSWAAEKSVFILPAFNSDTLKNPHLRIGFASMEEEEMERATDILAGINLNV